VVLADIAWHDVGFRRVGCSPGGGLLASTNRTGSETRFIHILSELDGTTKLRVHDPAWDCTAAPPTAILASGKVIAVPGAPGDWAVTLAKNQSALLHMGATALEPAELIIAPCEGNVSEYHWFGYTWEMPQLH
jgi:hypothetical protein